MTDDTIQELENAQLLQRKNEIDNILENDCRESGILPATLSSQWFRRVLDDLGEIDIEGLTLDEVGKLSRAYVRARVAENKADSHARN